MSFKDINIKYEYRSLSDDIVSEFYIPLLKEASEYKRAVGFFSSSALVEISKGIAEFSKNGGTISLIASPHLSDEDLIAMKKGYECRDDIIKKVLNRDLKEPKNHFEHKRLNLLANLISNGLLDIKIALIGNSSNYGIYHEKVGIMKDKKGNKISFSGSMNESITALRSNYESVDVFCSWKSESELERVEAKEKVFDCIWNNNEKHIETIKIPNLNEEIIKKYRRSPPDFRVDEDDFKLDVDTSENEYGSEINIPIEFNLRDYQKEAIKNWKNKDYRGIFDMATGTGKTHTSLSAAVTLYKETNGRVAILIVCPYQHLVNQWIEDIELYGMKPIICYSASSQKNWKEKLSDSCMSFELGIKDHLCAIFTNATYASSFVQSTIKPILSESLLIVDEAHNFGASNMSKALNEKINYRLGLSATIERYRDSEGTEKLLDFFGDKCIEYTLENAIENGMLCKYYYYPILVSFSEEELERYVDISKKISKAIMFSQNKNNSCFKLTDSAKILLIKRARLVSAASEKIVALCEEIEKYKDKRNILVYCGATTMREVEDIKGCTFDEEKRQIDIVLDMLGNGLNMKVAKFTSEESAVEREYLKKEFGLGGHLQALVAIRCLDEGVNIPSIETAFILASSSNPKEYIQRRGRVLRKFDGKTHANIYDFILSPIPIEEVQNYDDSMIACSKSIVRKEIDRMIDFSQLSENPSSADEIIYELLHKYDIDLNNEEGDYYE